MDFAVIGQNLVPNPSFEKIDSIPCKWTAIEEFNVLFKDWFQPTRGTTDVFTTYVDPSCYAHCYSTHENAMGYQTPRTGRVMGAILTSGFGCNKYSYREYLAIRLKEKLQKGKIYYAEMYVSHMDSSNIATNNIGFYFSTDSIAQHDYFDCFNLWVIPQINEDSVIEDNYNWVKVSGYFTAEDDYEYMILGNMYHDGQTIIRQVGYFGGRNANWSGKYYVDDVLVRPCLSATPDTLVCQGSSVELKAWGNPIYGWAEEKKPDEILETSQTFTVSPYVSTTYLVYGECDTLSVTVTLPESLRDTAMCEGESIDINLKYKDPSKIWIPDSLLTISEAGTYAIKRKLPGCIQTDTIRVTYKTKPKLELEEVAFICRLDTIILNVAEPGLSVEWEDASTDPKRIITNPGYYTVRGWIDGCFNENSINIGLGECVTELVMPNVFTPNNDKVNDLFMPIKQEGVVSASIYIIDRYGTEVFVSEALDQYWDGTVDGQLASAGVYFYSIQLFDRNGEHRNFKGSFSLLR